MDINVEIQSRPQHHLIHCKTQIPTMMIVVDKPQATVDVYQQGRPERMFSNFQIQMDIRRTHHIQVGPRELPLRLRCCGQPGRILSLNRYFVCSYSSYYAIEWYSDDKIAEGIMTLFPLAICDYSKQHRQRLNVKARFFLMHSVLMTSIDLKKDFQRNSSKWDVVLK